MHDSSVHPLKIEGSQQLYLLDPTLCEVINPRNFAIFLDLHLSRVQAGFSSPADDYAERTLDLNNYLIDRPAATLFVRVSGDSMIGAGIHHQDILVVDRSLQPKDRDIIIAVLNGELTVKRFEMSNDSPALKSEHPDFPEIYIKREIDFYIWGVVTSVIHQFRRN